MGSGASSNRNKSSANSSTSYGLESLSCSSARGVHHASDEIPLFESSEWDDRGSTGTIEAKGVDSCSDRNPIVQGIGMNSDAKSTVGPSSLPGNETKCTSSSGLTACSANSGSAEFKFSGVNPDGASPGEVEGAQRRSLPYHNIHDSDPRSGSGNGSDYNRINNNNNNNADDEEHGYYCEHRHVLLSEQVQGRGVNNHHDDAEDEEDDGGEVNSNNDNVASLFACTAMSLGMDQDELLFNMLYFGDGNASGAGNLNAMDLLDEQGIGEDEVSGGVSGASTLLHERTNVSGDEYDSDAAAEEEGGDRFNGSAVVPPGLQQQSRCAGEVTRVNNSSGYHILTSTSTNNRRYRGGNNGISMLRSMLNNTVEETIAAHSANNTPYKLKPVDDAVIKRFTVRKYAAESKSYSTSVTTTTSSYTADTVDATEGDEDAEIVPVECMVCRDAIQEGDDVVELAETCRHMFHAECITRWLKLQSWCPVCRTSVIKVEQDRNSEEISDTSPATVMLQVGLEVGTTPSAGGRHDDSGGSEEPHEAPAAFIGTSSGGSCGTSCKSKPSNSVGRGNVTIHGSTTVHECDASGDLGVRLGSADGSSLCVAGCTSSLALAGLVGTAPASGSNVVAGMGDLSKGSSVATSVGAAALTAAGASTGAAGQGDSVYGEYYDEEGEMDRRTLQMLRYHDVPGVGGFVNGGELDGPEGNRDVGVSGGQRDDDESGLNTHASSASASASVSAPTTSVSTAAIPVAV